MALNTFSNGNGKSQHRIRGVGPKARLVLSRQQEYQIGRILEAAVEPAGNGKVRYKEGWNDERIAQEAQIIAPVNVDHVIRLRKQVFGDLKVTNSGVNPMTVAHAKIADLTARVEALEAAITNPNK